MAQAVLTMGEKTTLSLYKTPVKSGGHCFANNFIANKNQAQFIVNSNYDRVVIREDGKSDVKVALKKITPKDKEAFFVGRTDKWKVTLSYSKFYEEDPERNPKYYAVLAMLDPEQQQEELEKEAEYSAKEKEYFENKAVEVDFDNNEDISI